MYPHIRTTIAVFTIILSFFNFSFSQKNIGIKGSFFIAAIANDGIMVSTESRGNFYDISTKSQTPIAYFDGIQKAFVIGNSVMASTGSGVCGDYFLCTIIEEFKKQIKKEIPTSQLIKSFLKYCENNLKPSSYLTISKNLLVAGGYENNKPIISFYNGIDNEYGIINEGYVESDISSFTTKYSKNKDTQTLGNFATNAIYQYAKDHNKVNTIGGNVSVVKITTQNITWIKNKPSCTWFDIQSFVREYKKGNAKVYFPYPKNKDILVKLFKDYE